MIEVICPSDGTLHYAEESNIGKTLRCRKCGKMLTVGEEVPRAPVNPEGLKGSPPLPAAGAPLPEGKTAGKARKLSATETYIAIGAGLGAVVVALLIFFWPGAPQVSPPAQPAQTTPAQPASGEPSSGGTERAPAKHAPSSKAAKTELAAESHPEPLPCAQGHEPVRLKTGEKIEPDAGTPSGESNIRMSNAADLDAAVRLVDNVTRKTSRFVYVQAGHFFALQGIEPGGYILRVQFGRDWVPACRAFTQDSTTIEYATPFVFREDSIRFYEVTLSPAASRRAGTRTIDRARFLEGD